MHDKGNLIICPMPGRSSGSDKNQDVAEQSLTGRLANPFSYHMTQLLRGCGRSSAWLTRQSSINQSMFLFQATRPM